MRARSALFDVYGDHLRARGDQAPVAALVRLLAPVGIAAPAVRTAISRMVVQDWLAPVLTPRRPGLPRHRAGDPPPRRGGRPGSTAAGRPRVGRQLAPRGASSTQPAARTAHARLRAELGFMGTPSSPTASGSARSPAASWPRSWRRRAPGRGHARADASTPPRPAPGTSRLRTAYDTWLADGRRAGRAAHAGPTRTPTRRPSRPGSTWSTSGASSSSPTRGCPTSCCRRTGRAAAAAELFASEATRLEPGADRFVLPAA